MRLLVLVLLTAAFAGACRSAPTPDEAAEGIPEAGAIFELVAGSWDWARGDSTCVGNTHTISFHRAGREMRLTFREPIDTATGQRIVRYSVLQAGSNVLPDLPVVVRAAMEGESRRTDAGQLVVWDLVMATPNRYHWHRTDWPDGGMTGAVVRCDGTRPLERWQPPATGASGD